MAISVGSPNLADGILDIIHSINTSNGPTYILYNSRFEDVYFDWSLETEDYIQTSVSPGDGIALRMVPGDGNLDGYTDLDPGPPSESYDQNHDGNLRMIRTVYDERRVLELDDTLEEISSSEFSGLLLRILAVVVLLGVVAFWTVRRRETDLGVQLIDSMDLEAEGAALEADLVSVGALKADD